MVMGRGKEVRLDLPYDYNIISGTVDNKNPKSIYIQISAWGKPKEYLNCDYEGIIRNKSKRVKNKLYEVINKEVFYKDKAIVDFNMASSGISPNKRSYMSVEMTLFKKEPLIPINSEEILPVINNISERIIKDVFEKDEHFNFYRTKK
jgi:hypothetical protein